VISTHVGEKKAPPPGSDQSMAPSYGKAQLFQIMIKKGVAGAIAVVDIAKRRKKEGPRHQPSRKRSREVYKKRLWFRPVAGKKICSCA